MEKKFDFETSVFKNWRIDSPKDVKKAMTHDRKYWKINRMTKNPTVENEVAKMVQDNFKVLNEIFLTVAMSDGTFPTINMISYLKFCREAQLSCKNVSL